LHRVYNIGTVLTAYITLPSSVKKAMLVTFPILTWPASTTHVTWILRTILKTYLCWPWQSRSWS